MRRVVAHQPMKPAMKPACFDLYSLHPHPCFVCFRGCLWSSQMNTTSLFSGFYFVCCLFLSLSFFVLCQVRGYGVTAKQSSAPCSVLSPIISCHHDYGTKTRRNEDIIQSSENGLREVTVADSFTLK